MMFLEARKASEDFEPPALSCTHNPSHTMPSLTSQHHTKESIYESTISASQEFPALYEERMSITVLTTDRY